MNRSFLLLATAFSLTIVGCGTNESAPVEPQGAATKAPPSTPVATEKPKEAYKSLEIDSVQKQSSTIDIEGHTDLPNGSSLIVSFGVKTKHDTDEWFGTDGKTVAADGKWKISLDLPQVPEFNREPHVADVSFTPVGQSDSVLAFTGSKGEKLKGAHTKKFGNGNSETMFDVEKEIRLRLPKAVADNLPNPSSYNSNSPEHAVALVLRDWKRHNWQGMADHVYTVFDSTESDRLEKCKDNFGFWDIHEATITDVDKSSEGVAPIGNLPGNIANVTVHVKASMGSEMKDENMTWVVLRRDKNHHASEHGKWAVNIEAVGPK